jgi:hypothetical protein
MTFSSPSNSTVELKGARVGSDLVFHEFLRRVAVECPALSSIWLIGSRANGTATPTSDWDFIAFGTLDSLNFLRTAVHLHRHDTDFLVVTNGDDFAAAWGSTDKTGSLKGWEWEKVTESLSRYTQVKRVKREDGAGVQLLQKQAIRVWSKTAR